MTIKRNLFRDILRDTNSTKYSMTKFVAFTAHLSLLAAVGSAIAIMIINKEIDHILIGELIALVLTLLGFKNFRGNFNMGAGKPKIPDTPQGGDKVDEEDHSDELG
jgi:hypothetical protein